MKFFIFVLCVFVNIFAINKDSICVDSLTTVIEATDSIIEFEWQGLYPDGYSSNGEYIIQIGTSSFMNSGFGFDSAIKMDTSSNNTLSGQIYFFNGKCPANIGTYYLPIPIQGTSRKILKDSTYFWHVGVINAKKLWCWSSLFSFTIESPTRVRALSKSMDRSIAPAFYRTPYYVDLYGRHTAQPKANSIQLDIANDRVRIFIHEP
jgi:hypothetical protein